MKFSRPLYWLGGKFVKVYSKIMLRMSVVSHFPIPKGPKILVANHPTTSDPFILTSYSNGQAAVLIKNIIFGVPVFGHYLNWAGHIPVVSGEENIAFERALKLLKNGVTVIVFIEGDLSKFIHKIGKPKTGAIRLALISGVPLVPIGISVKQRNIKILKSVVRNVQDWGKWYFRGPYALTIGKSFNINGNVFDRANVRKSSKSLSNKIKVLQKESRKRIS